MPALLKQLFDVKYGRANVIQYLFIRFVLIIALGNFGLECFSKTVVVAFVFGHF
jgi:hypothetical protein